MVGGVANPGERYTWSCLELFLFVPTFLSSISLNTQLLFSLCLLLPLISSLLFSWATSRNSIVRSLALVSSCLGLFPFVPPFLSSRFLTILHYSCVCFFLLLHPYRFHARDVLCGIHTSCICSPFPIVQADWSLVI